MAPLVRVRNFLGTGLLACVWLFCGTLPIRSADSVPVATGITDAEAGPLLPPGFQEQQELMQQAIEQTRREAEAAVKRNSDTVAARLDLIERALAQQHKRELEALQNSNRTTLMVAGILAGTGFLGMLCLALFLMRASNRLTEMTMAVVPLSHRFAPGPAFSTLALGRDSLAAANPAERAGAHLLGAIEQLEKRLNELEQTTQLPSSSSAERAMRDGDEQAAAQDNDPAAAQTPAVDSDQAARVVLMLAKGQTLLNLEQPEEALACFDEVIALEPHNAEAYVKKGAALEKLQREDEAVECYDRAIAADSSLTTAYLHKGGVFNRLERYQEALACYEQALKTEQKSLAS